jgi:hypothetical protein
MHIACWVAAFGAFLTLVFLVDRFLDVAVVAGVASFAAAFASILPVVSLSTGFVSVEHSLLRPSWLCSMNDSFNRVDISTHHCSVDLHETFMT